MLGWILMPGRLMVRALEVNDQLSDMRDVVEPLEPAAERIGKLAERLPGKTRPAHQRG
jgi:hypothetical protein